MINSDISAVKLMTLLNTDIESVRSIMTIK